MPEWSNGLGSKPSGLVPTQVQTLFPAFRKMSRYIEPKSVPRGAGEIPPNDLVFAPPGAMQDRAGNVVVDRDPKRSSDSDYWWDLKYRTTSCEGCEHLVRTETEDFCGWGVAGKKLMDAESPRRCNLLNGSRGKSGGYSAERLKFIVNELGWDGRFLNKTVVEQHEKSRGLKPKEEPQLMEETAQLRLF